jgi:GTP cyclohydrolase I
MSDQLKHQNKLPDSQSEKLDKLLGTLQWVGMENIQTPLLVSKKPTSEVQKISASVDAMVSLDNSSAKGIHMSRLYLEIQETLSQELLSETLLKNLLSRILKSHEGLSEKARVVIGFKTLLRRKALLSDNSGWRSYPTLIEAEADKNGHFKLNLQVEVAYSSTCPASASLARKLIQEQFVKDFSESQNVDLQKVTDWLSSTQGIVATPHSQRSLAHVKVQLKTGSNLDPEALINLIEDILKTPVQGAVKREDEQAFALLNGQNLMFCEDAARRVQSQLGQMDSVVEFVGKFEHIESLHPHSAVSFIKKSIKSPELSPFK